jgi:hypothetical protein
MTDRDVTKDQAAIDYLLSCKKPVSFLDIASKTLLRSPWDLFELCYKYDVWLKIHCIDRVERDWRYQAIRIT